jgi:excisionase family DNA binding protein
MASIADSVPVGEAAHRLGISEQRVRAMIASGRLPAEKLGGVWWIPQRALARDRYAAPSPGRPFSAAHAWAVLLLASGENDLAWISRQSRWRIRSALRSAGVEGLVGRLVNRGASHAYQAHPGELNYLAEEPEVMRTGSSAADAHGLGLHGGGGELHAYVPAAALDPIRDEHALESADFSGTVNVVLRAVPDDVWEHVSRPVAPLAAVLADLIVDPDPRARRVGGAGLRRLDGAREL